MAFTDDQIAAAVRRVLERPTLPDKDSSGQADGDEQFARVMSYVYLHFLMYPKLTYRLAVLARDKLLQSAKNLSDLIEVAIQGLVDADLPDSSVDGGDYSKVVAVAASAAESTAFKGSDFSARARRFLRYSDKLLKNARRTKESNRTSGLQAALDSVSYIAALMPALFDDMNYLLRHDEQVDFVELKQLTSQFVLDNISRSLGNREEDLADESKAQDITLDVLAARAALQMIDERREAYEPYVRSTGLGGGAVPARTDYAGELVGDISEPLLVTYTSGPFTFLFGNSTLALRSRHAVTNAILTEEEYSFPEALSPSAADGLKIVAREPVPEGATVPQELKLLLRLNEKVHVITVPVGADVEFQMGVVDSHIKSFYPNSGCQWYMGVPETRRPCIYGDSNEISILELVGLYISEPADIHLGGAGNVFRNTAATFFGWAQDQSSSCGYAAEDLALNINSRFSNIWEAAAGGGAELYEDNDQVAQILPRYGVPQHLTLEMTAYEDSGFVYARFSEPLSVEYIGYHIIIGEGPDRGTYQLLGPKGFFVDEETDWILQHVGCPPGWPRLAYQQPVPVEMDSTHLEIALRGQGPLVKAEADLGLGAAYTMGINSSGLAYKNQMEIRGSRPDKAGTWRFDFGKAQVERGDYLRIRILPSSDSPKELSGNLIDSVIDSENFSGIAVGDNVHSNRRLLLNMGILCGSTDGEVVHSQVELKSYYLYYHELLEREMARFREQRLRGRFKVTLYDYLTRGGLPEQMSLWVQSRADRQKLMRQLGEVYLSLLREGSHTDFDGTIKLLSSAGVSIAQPSSPITVEDVLLAYDPPDQSSVVRGAVDNVIRALSSAGYDQALDLLTSLRLPGFFALPTERASYASQFEYDSRRMSLRLPEDPEVDSHSGHTVIGQDADDVLDDDLPGL